jgi:D-glycero-beta-D-manno-heptose 1-phosphate adenylyltransferase
MRIVFTNGCFDILHRGHVEYLKKAKLLGDILIVGLNSDSSVRRIKGDKRPINNESDRAIVLKELKSVDEVIIFQEETPLDLIKKIKPDVLVKGGDWKLEDIVGYEFVINNGGKVFSIPYIKGYSTTDIINKSARIKG